LSLAEGRHQLLELGARSLAAAHQGRAA
jgi:hypothetical protein